MGNIQQWWNSEYDYINRIAIESKTSQSAWFELSRRYLALSESEKNEIAQVLIDWLDSEEGNRRSDALWLIREHKIFTAREALQRLCLRLKDCKIPNNPQGYHEREEALEILKLLEAG